MSFNRLRRLAGLNESFTDDPELNHEIEQRLSRQRAGTQHQWMDILEIIYRAGRQGIDRQEIANQIADQYPNMAAEFGDNGLKVMLDKLVNDFDNVVTTDDNERFVWKYPAANDMDVEHEIDPNTRAAVGAQVGLASDALSLMRRLTDERGSFTEAELAHYLSLRSRIPPAIARQFAEHMIGQFQSMLTRAGDGYAMKTEKPVTNDDTMDFLRGIAKNPKTLPGE